MRDYYQILELNRDATPEQIRLAYRRLSKIWHPDVSEADPEVAAEMFSAINEAYRVLSDPDDRENFHRRWSHMAVQKRRVTEARMASRSGYKVLHSINEHRKHRTFGTGKQKRYRRGNRRHGLF